MSNRRKSRVIKVSARNSAHGYRQWFNQRSYLARFFVGQLIENAQWQLHKLCHAAINIESDEPEISACMRFAIHPAMAMAKGEE
jgi:hypothetical protein